MLIWIQTSKKEFICRNLFTCVGTTHTASRVDFFMQWIGLIWTWKWLAGGGNGVLVRAPGASPGVRARTVFIQFAESTVRPRSICVFVHSHVPALSVVVQNCMCKGAPNEHQAVRL